MSAGKAIRSPQPEIDTDLTAGRIRAYVASLQPLGGTGDGGLHQHFRGRSLIEQLALSSHGYGEPTLKLTASQCADIMAFMAISEPLEPRTWWSDPKDGPSHWVGFQFVLRAVEGTLRKGVRS